MSRDITRQVKRTQARKQAAFDKFAEQQYANGVRLADCHPDVKTVFSLVCLTVEAHTFGDQVAVSNGLGALKRLVEKYSSQVDKEELTDLD